MLVATALLVVVVGVSTFFMVDEPHAVWVFLGWVGVSFFAAAVRWDYRREFRSLNFVLFFLCWIAVYGLVFESDEP